MKKNLAFLSAFITAGMLAVPAYAADSPSCYVSGNVGAAWFNDITPQNQGSVSTKGGINAMGALGLKFCDTYRLEAEGGYQRNNLSSASGFLSATSVLANGYYDFSAYSVKPYLTAGLGWASVGGNGLGFSDSQSVFAYQFGAGIAIPVAKNIDIDARYRYFRTSTINPDNIEGFQISSNSVLAGLRVGF